MGICLRQLAAPAPTWERDVDVVVLGSGAAGLAAALAVRPVRSALIVTKGDARRRLARRGPKAGWPPCSTPTDSLENHVRDTLAAGAGLCDEAVVRELVAEAPTAIRYLMRLGAAFDPAAHDGDEPGAGPRGRPQPPPDRPLGRRPQRRRGPADARPIGGGGRCRGARAGLRPRPRRSARRPDGQRQAAGVAVAMLDADRCGGVGRRRHRPRRGRSPPAATARCSHRRRTRPR